MNIKSDAIASRNSSNDSKLGIILRTSNDVRFDGEAIDSLAHAVFTNRQKNTEHVPLHIRMHDADCVQRLKSHTHARYESSSLQSIRVNWINFGS